LTGRKKGGILEEMPQRQQLGFIHAGNEKLDVRAAAEATAFYKYFIRNDP
jgi:hypothetical protein